MDGHLQHHEPCYDAQAHSHHWYPEALFGLCYEYLRPGHHLLDVGIGTGLCAEAFARAGQEVFGIDESPEMLDACRRKGIARELRQHDLRETPWPYPDGAFDQVISFGVLHFLPELEPVFDEVERLLRPGGIFAFTTKEAPAEKGVPYQTEVIQDTTLYLHGRAYLDELLARYCLAPRKEMRLLVRTGRGSDDVFRVIVTQKL